MWQTIRRYLNQHSIKRRQQENALVTLVQVACETPQIRQQLQLILSQPQQQREDLIDKWIAELRQEAAPATLIDLLTLLQDNQLAERVLIAVNRYEKQ